MYPGKVKVLGNIFVCERDRKRERERDNTCVSVYELGPVLKDHVNSSVNVDLLIIMSMCFK